jgi:hypothetical protein
MKNSFAGNVYHANELIYLTNSGIRVRSKSERTIADALHQYAIPFRYEAALALDSEIKYPDFAIFRPSDGKLFLWEHFGLMDQDVYREKAIDKLYIYTRNGFYPFVNLICTYEQTLQNPSQIHSLIEIFLL